MADRPEPYAARQQRQLDEEGWRKHIERREDARRNNPDVERLPPDGPQPDFTPYGPRDPSTHERNQMALQRRLGRERAQAQRDRD